MTTLRTLSESVGALWVALTRAMEPHQRMKAADILREALEAGDFEDLEARCLVRSLVDDAEENFERRAVPIGTASQVAILAAIAEQASTLRDLSPSTAHLRNLIVQQLA
jgi:hypothetical protein